MKTEITKLKSLIEESENIVILSGAGVSTSSGIPDFRSQGGFYSDDSVTTYLHRYYFKKHPEEFWKHFKGIFGDKLLSGGYEENVCHTIVEDLINKGKKVSVVTQNIDGLYKRVMSENLYEMHGHLETYKCDTCGKRYDKEYVLENEVPYCNNETYGKVCGKVLNTNVVLFGDEIKYYNEAVDAIYNSDLLIVMGTSLLVYPVNSLVEMHMPRKKVIINKEETVKDHQFDLVIHGDLVEVLTEVSK